mgnify:CR=1 FL=1
MNPQIERLQALVAQLIARLEHERSESRRLASQLASREAELAQTKHRLEDMRRKVEALFSASRSGISVSAAYRTPAQNASPAPTVPLI